MNWLIIYNTFSKFVIGKIKKIDLFLHEIQHEFLQIIHQLNPQTHTTFITTLKTLTIGIDLIIFECRNFNYLITIFVMFLLIYICVLRSHLYIEYIKLPISLE